MGALRSPVAVIPQQICLIRNDSLKRTDRPKLTTLVDFGRISLMAHAEMLSDGSVHTATHVYS
eukprot:2380889-Amphidinium_carterae.1